MNKQTFLSIFGSCAPLSYSTTDDVSTVEVNGSLYHLSNPVPYKGQVVLANSCVYNLEGYVYNNHLFLGVDTQYNNPILLLS